MDKQEKKDWFEKQFSLEERLLVAEQFSRAGGISPTSLANSQDPSALGILAGHFKKSSIRHLGYCFIQRGMELVEACESLQSKHFFYSSAGAFHYRWREVDSGELETSIFFFKRQVSISSAVAPLLKQQIGFMPAQAGFRQMRIIYERQKEIASALTLCNKAKIEGWADDWDKHIARLQQKLFI